MKMRITVLIAILMMGVSIFWAQTHPETKPAAGTASCGLDRSDMQAEVKEMTVYTSRMESRIVMMRNSAGIVENPQLRNALQVNADMWQDELDHLKQHMTRLQTAADRCQAKEKADQNPK